MAERDDRIGKDVAGVQHIELEQRFVDEWLRQAKANAAMYAEALGMSEKEYIEGLPHFAPQPKAYIGRFDTPVIVQVPVPKKGLTLRRMISLSDISDWDNSAGVSVDWPDDPQGFKTPLVTYTTWLNDGAELPSRSPTAVRKALAPDERGGTVYDGLGLCVSDPTILAKQPLDFPGSHLDENYILTLIPNRGKPRVHYHVLEYAYPGLQTVVAGRQIVLATPPDQLPRQQYRPVGFKK